MACRHQRAGGTERQRSRSPPQPVRDLRANRPDRRCRLYSYARNHSEFPHESSADQWFSESQFESYRARGLHAVTQVSGGTASSDFDEFLGNVRDYLLKKEDREVS